MSPLIWIGVAALGGLAAVARFLVDGAVTARTGGRFPTGTHAVNLSGAVALGVFASAIDNPEARLLVATGFLGAYTTFSTWMFESHRLAEDGEPALAWANIAGPAALGLVALWIGLQLGGGL